ncbi:hypothetical protein [Streptomyces sioyaensis]|uniref:hypothetical protein n=1 Tax=Streptomyces sioyaensis TaxID=67364 RepID=UPI003791FD9C
MRPVRDTAARTVAAPARTVGALLGRLRHALPPVSFDGAPATWATPPGRCGTDAPVWR